MQVANQVNLREGTSVTFTILEGGLLVKPYQKKYALDDLLAGMSLDSVHSEIEMGQPAGDEIW